MISPPRKWIKYRSGLSWELFVNLGSSWVVPDPSNSQDPYKASFATTLIPGKGDNPRFIANDISFKTTTQFEADMKDQNSDSASQSTKKQNPVMFKTAVPPTSRSLPPKPWICWRWLLLWHIVTEILPWWITTIKPWFGNIGFLEKFSKASVWVANSKKWCGQASDATRRASRILCVVTRG